MKLCAAASVVAVLVLIAPASVACWRPLENLPSILVRPASAIAESFAKTQQQKPWFCHDTECPEFKVLNHTDAYETRQYARTKWAVTKVEGLLYEPSLMTGFKRLFDYISGENEGSIKIPMTSPVLTGIEPGQGAFCKSNFSVAFYVPAEFQNETPEPTNKDVYLLSMPERVAYVSQFGGYLVDDLTLSAKAKALHNALVADGQTFVDGVYFTAGYDPPFRVQHRHNEIWFSQEKAEAVPASI